MKRYWFKLSVILLILLSLIIVSKTLAKLPLEGKTIVLDAGHGGLDPGTMYQNIYEKDINLAIVLALENELKELGAKVILTRSGDYDLAKPKAKWRKKSDFDNRIKLINGSNASLYVSIHLNYLSDSSYYGPQVFYNNDNKELAEIIQKNMNASLKGDRDIKKIPTDTYMYSKLKVPGVLIECGFLSNGNERKLLITKDYQEKVAKSISKGIIEYFNT